MNETNDPHFDLPNAEPSWLTGVIENNGEECQNCGSWRILDNPIIEECAVCGDEEFNINLADEYLENLPR